MPLLPSSTTFSGVIRVRVDEAERVLAEGVAHVLGRDLRPAAPPAVPARPPVTISRSSPMPESPESASAPRFTSFAPVYAGGLCEAVHMSPPSSSRAPTVQYSCSVPTIPTSSTSAPSSAMPRAYSAAMLGAESRMSRPSAPVSSSTGVS